MNKKFYSALAAQLKTLQSYWGHRESVLPFLNRYVYNIQSLLSESFYSIMLRVINFPHPRLAHRSIATIAIKALKYKEYGEPSEVLELVEDNLPQPSGDQVLVRILAAPINPADINAIQGKYPLKPQLPAVAGMECVGEVLCVGENVTNLYEGQRVVRTASGLGTWRTHALFKQQQLMPISEKIELAAAATLSVNPPTAYRMLKDFVPLRKGDCVIQNGANSAVGQAVHQLCKAWGVESVGVVRDRKNIDEVKEYLKYLGASEILTEEELEKTKIFKEGTLPPPRLGLNCVGGRNAAEVTRQLTTKGVMVTYGGMSRQPVTASTPALIFKDIAFHGFWVPRWFKEHSQSKECEEMFEELFQLIEEGKFKPPKHEIVPLPEYRDAVTAALDVKGQLDKKFILYMQCD